ncbi:MULTISPECIES: hypothetical protein [Lysinibacillus]|uniref:hypothetical protein n=1 Tax=Lysinibacillus TaxID=400634 RepID=UPI00214D09C8|nr:MULTISPECIES: hypothetical protein [Lysinibacillus]UUV23831.1 hypothetical protein NP781_18785 [Lysinibacillus sp. FN11]UYB46703.1 hypothetical protein OCI51_21395 [Lysinibacillus capsici]
MAQKPVPAKEKKLSNLFEKHGLDISEEQFIEIFKEEYSKDWSRIQETYAKQEEKRKPGQAAPMPEPTKYLQNMYKVFIKKHS